MPPNQAAEIPMDFTPFLSPVDTDRAARTLALLRRHRIEPFVLTGGLATELHRIRLGRTPQTRPLNDIDFLVNAFQEIPTTLSADLLFRHVHPHDPPGKTLLQGVAPETGVRVDIFRACGHTLTRAIPIDLCGASMQIVSIEDLISRTARLCMDLAAGKELPLKHAQDFLRLLPLVRCDQVVAVWQEHRKPNHPQSFAAVADLLQNLIGTRTDLQTVPRYSQDIHVPCSRCESTDHFPLAQAADVLSLLGYC